MEGEPDRVGGLRKTFPEDVVCSLDLKAMKQNSHNAKDNTRHVEDVWQGLLGYIFSGLLLNSSVGCVGFSPGRRRET